MRFLLAGLAVGAAIVGVVAWARAVYDEEYAAAKAARADAERWRTDGDFGD